LQAKNETSLVVPVVEDTLPLPGAVSTGAHTLGMHRGAVTLQSLLAMHEAAFSCDSVKPASQAKYETSPVVPDVADTLPLPGALSAGAHEFATQFGEVTLQKPLTKHAAAFVCDKV
jgi:hypothetical protein